MIHEEQIQHDYLERLGIRCADNPVMYDDKELALLQVLNDCLSFGITKANAEKFVKKSLLKLKDPMSSGEYVKIIPSRYDLLTNPKVENEISMD